MTAADPTPNDRDESVAGSAAAGGSTPAARRVLDRRAALAAAAGLVVGAGGAEGIRALVGGGSPHVAARPPTPGEALMTEHGVLKRLLLGYTAAADQLAAGHTPPMTAIAQAAALIADYIEGFHEGLEEGYVFPRVRAQQGTLVNTLLVQHDRGRHLTAAISAVASAGPPDAKARAALQRYLTLFVRMYAPHEAWEDTVIFPTLREVAGQRTLDDLAERFAELEDRQYGPNALAEMLGTVTSVEKALGIGDLAAFTPPEIAG